MIYIQYHKHFIKKLKHYPPKIRKKTKEQILLFAQNSYDTQLNNHRLKGKYIGYHSINITGDLRAVFKKQSEQAVIFTDIDNHNNLYK